MAISNNCIHGQFFSQLAYIYKLIDDDIVIAAACVTAIISWLFK
jgi:hypothetical protein